MSKSDVIINSNEDLPSMCNRTSKHKIELFEFNISDNVEVYTVEKKMLSQISKESTANKQEE